MDYSPFIKEYLRREIQVIESLDTDAVNRALGLLAETYEKEGRVYIFGNGGSAATASHFANDFNKGLSEYVEKKFHFVCLNDNVPTVLAIANDIGYEEIFRFQLKGRLKANDLVMAVSGSGNSPNVLLAAEYAKEAGAKVIGLTGYGGGRLAPLADVSLHVPINSMQITEDIHMIFDHLMMSVFYAVLCGKNHLS